MKLIKLKTYVEKIKENFLYQIILKLLYNLI